MMKKVIIVCASVAALIIVFWVSDIISDRTNKLEILKPIILLEKSPQDYPKENREIGKVQIGEKVKVLRMGYGKDFRAWKVRINSGIEGWFIEEDSNIKLNGTVAH